MLYSKLGSRLVFVLDEGFFPQDSICDIVDGIYSSVKTRQVIKAAKQEVAYSKLIQELVDPTCEINQSYREEDLIHDDTFYFEMAAFEFQDTVFFVPTNQFVQKTDPDHFAAIFGPTFGTTEAPKQFPGVTASDFRSLMKSFYPLDVNDSQELTKDDWIAILRLSTKWRMLALREKSIRMLNNNTNRLSAIAKVQLGYECKITEWVRSGLVALAECDEHFTEADVIAIGLENVTKLCEVREQGYAGEWDTYCNRLTLEAHGTSNLIADRISQISTVDHLDFDDTDLVTAVLDAQSLGNPRLMLDAWGRMARRLESLTLDEVGRLTLGIALMIWEVRLETRRAAWWLVQECREQCDVKASDTSQLIASAFAAELTDIEVQASNYAWFQYDDEEEIPDSALEPMPSESSRDLFEKSLALRRRIVDLEHMSNENAGTTLGRQLRKDLRRCRLSAQKWRTLAADSSTPVSTLNLSTIGAPKIAATLEDIVTKLILKNVAKLCLDGTGVALGKWNLRKPKILDFAAQYRLETQIREDSQVIDLILPVSES